MTRARPIIAAWPAAALLALLGMAAAALLSAGAASAEAPTLNIAYPEPSSLFGISALDRGNGLAVVESMALITDSDTEIDNVTLSWSLVPDYDSLAAKNSTFNVNHTSLNSAEARLSLWLPDGTYTLRWSADDGAGGVANTSVSFTVDLHAPAIFVDLPPLTRFANITVSVDIQDAVSGVNASSIVVQFRSACSTQWAAAAPRTTVLPGRVIGSADVRLCPGIGNSLQVSAADAAGNTATGLVATAILDESAPRVTPLFPQPFSNVVGSGINVSAQFNDDYAGVNASSIQVQVSHNGGLTYGNWSSPEIRADGGLLIASLYVPFKAGESGAMRWRAFDQVGNGPGPLNVTHFQVNGEPFLISFEPPEGSRFIEGQLVTFTASFADPDADFVRAEFYSDVDGYLGQVSGYHNITPIAERFTHVLSKGVHNITIVGDDGRGHRVSYVYEVEVTERPPPDYRFFLLIPLLLLTMAAAVWYVWTRSTALEDKPREDPPEP